MDTVRLSRRNEGLSSFGGCVFGVTVVLRMIRLFVTDRRLIAKGRVQPAGVVPPFDEVEDAKARLFSGCIGRPFDKLTFERSKERLAHSIVVAVPNRTHGGSYGSVLTALPEGQRCVLRSLVGVVDCFFWPTLLGGHV